MRLQRAVVKDVPAEKTEHLFEIGALLRCRSADQPLGLVPGQAAEGGLAAQSGEMLRDHLGHPGTKAAHGFIVQVER
jgi:hypothetical protein